MEQSTAVTPYSPQQAALLEKARKSTARPSVQFIPDIKMMNHGSEKVDGVKKGEFYTRVYNGKESVCTGIGAHPQFIILHRAYTSAIAVFPDGVQHQDDPITGDHDAA